MTDNLPSGTIEGFHFTLFQVRKYTVYAKGLKTHQNIH